MISHTWCTTTCQLFYPWGILYARRQLYGSLISHLTHTGTGVAGIYNRITCADKHPTSSSSVSIHYGTLDYTVNDRLHPTPHNDLFRIKGLRRIAPQACKASPAHRQPHNAAYVPVVHDTAAVFHWNGEAKVRRDRSRARLPRDDRLQVLVASRKRAVHLLMIHVARANAMRGTDANPRGRMAEGRRLGLCGTGATIVVRPDGEVGERAAWQRMI